MENRRRIAIVTGGARGIGRAIARSFAADGISPVIADIDFDTAEKTAREVRSSGVEAAAIRFDASKTEDVVHLIDQTVAMFGRLDVLRITPAF